MKNLVFVICATIFLMGCKEDPPVNTAELPTNLSFTVEESATEEGFVTVEAAATNQNYFTIIFNDQDDSTIIESNSGVETYQYLQEGDFTIRVRANTSYTDYISSSKTINIDFEEPDLSDTSGYRTPLSYPGYSFVWQDEFDGTSLNMNDWNFETGNGSGGWGNNELQYYREENTTVANGHLTIEAKTEPFNGFNYTSSRLTTQNKVSFQYGRIDIRAKLPYGQGMWPALWMLGDNINSVGWPRCGEIDIMELVGGNVPGGGDNKVHGTVHWDNAGTKADYGAGTTLSSGIFAEKYHVFSLVWDSQKIVWLLDDVEFNSIEITDPNLSEFRAKFFFIFNVAVGGNWPGSPDATTKFPQKMIVDYIRVFQ